MKIGVSSSEITSDTASQRALLVRSQKSFAVLRRTERSLFAHRNRSLYCVAQSAPCSLTEIVRCTASHRALLCSLTEIVRCTASHRALLVRSQKSFAVLRRTERSLFAHRNRSLYCVTQSAPCSLTEIVRCTASHRALLVRSQKSFAVLRRTERSLILRD